MTTDPVFLRVNRTLSLTWAAVVAWTGVALAAGWGPLAQWLPTALAGPLSAWLPPRLARRALAERIAAADPHPWPSPLQAPVSDAAAVDVDVAVIGAGVGGLTAGALLARAGARVAVFEQHDKPGGFCHCWEGTAWIDGQPRVFRFDAGVHDVSGWFEGATVASILDRLDLASALEGRRLDHAFVDAQGRWDAPRDWDAFVHALARRHPACGAGLRSLMADLATIVDSMYATARERGGVPGQPATVDGLMAFARHHPLAAAWVGRPLADLMRHHGVDGSARRLVERIGIYVSHTPGHLRVGEFAPLIGYFRQGGRYPVGGSGALTQALADSIALDGGDVRLGTPVAGVVLDATGTAVGGVRLADGTVVRARAVVYNGDAIAFAQRMLPDAALPPAMRTQFRTLEPAMSMFSVHLGVQGPLPDLPPVIHLAADDLEMEVVLPGVVDATSAPAGFHTVELMRVVPPDEAAGWFDEPDLTDPVEQRRSPAYQDRKARMADAMIAQAETLMPGLAGRIVFRREASPVTFRRYGRTTQGSVYGVGLPFGQVRRRSPLRGLVFAGAVTHGPGVEPAMMSGAEAADALLPGLLRDPSLRLA
jgi:all-trans-retinol 13,14-reductase